ncbi:MmpS family transport accessory protein [Micromonospora sp. M12]
MSDAPRPTHPLSPPDPPSGGSSGRPSHSRRVRALQQRIRPRHPGAAPGARPARSGPAMGTAAAVDAAAVDATPPVTPWAPSPPATQWTPQPPAEPWTPSSPPDASGSTPTGPRSPGWPTSDATPPVGWPTPAGEPPTAGWPQATGMPPAGWLHTRRAAARRLDADRRVTAARRVDAVCRAARWVVAVRRVDADRWAAARVDTDRWTAARVDADRRAAAAWLSAAARLSAAVRVPRLSAAGRWRGLAQRPCCGIVIAVFAALVLVVCGCLCAGSLFLDGAGRTRPPRTRGGAFPTMARAPRHDGTHPGATRQRGSHPSKKPITRPTSGRPGDGGLRGHRRGTADIAYYDAESDLMHVDNAKLPWRMTIRTNGKSRVMVEATWPDSDDNQRPLDCVLTVTGAGKPIVDRTRGTGGPPATPTEAVGGQSRLIDTGSLTSRCRGAVDTRLQGSRVDQARPRAGGTGLGRPVAVGWRR